jgi:hypothetical protein
MGTFSTALTAAESGTGVARVLFVGDSLLEGEGASTRDNRATAKFIAGARTNSGLPVGGAGMIQHYQATQLADSASWRNPLTASSGIVANSWFSTQGQRGADYDSTGDWAEWTVTGTSVDFVGMHGTADGGSFQVSVDGAAPVTIDTGSGTFLVSVPTRVPLGAHGAHTIKATLTAGKGTADGLVVYDGDETTGITWWDCTHFGYTSPQFNSANIPDVRKAWASYSPHLVIDNLTGLNDWQNNVALATFQSNLTSRLSTYAAIPTVPTVVLLYTYKLASQTTATNSLGLTVQNYFDAATAAAASYANAQVLDLNAVYPNFASTAGWLASDNGHPSDTGHQQIANALLSLVAPVATLTGSGSFELPGTTASGTGALIPALPSQPTPPVRPLSPDAEEFDLIGKELLAHTKFVPDSGNPTGDPIPLLDRSEWEIYVHNNPLGWGWGRY